MARKCKFCENPLVQRSYEAKSKFKRRVYCDACVVTAPPSTTRTTPEPANVSKPETLTIAHATTARRTSGVRSAEPSPPLRRNLPSAWTTGLMSRVHPFALILRERRLQTGRSKNSVRYMKRGVPSIGRFEKSPGAIGLVNFVHWAQVLGVRVRLTRECRIEEGTAEELIEVLQHDHKDRINDHVADRAGYDHVSVWEWVHGVEKPLLTSFIDWSNALGWTVALTIDDVEILAI